MTKVTAPLDDLSRAVNLDAARTPRLDGRQIVNDERDLCVAIQHVSVLAREHRAMRANEDLAAIQREANSVHGGLAAGSTVANRANRCV